MPFSAGVKLGGGTLLLSAFDPEIDGALVAWTSRLFTQDSRIAVRDLTDATTAYIGTGDNGAKVHADVSLGRVAYEDRGAGNGDIRVWDSTLAVDTPIATTSDNEVSPRIDGNLVLWFNDTDDELWYRDVGRGFNAKVPTTAPVNSVNCYDVDNGTIVWAEGLVTQQIRTYVPGLSGASSSLVGQAPAGADIITVQIHGDRVAYTLSDAGNLDAKVIELRSKTVTNLNPGSVFEESRPAVFHKGATWQTSQGGTWDVFFRMIGDSVTNVAGSADEEQDAAIFGRRIAYERDDGENLSGVWLAKGAPESARIEGTDRYRTAVEVSKSYFAKAHSAVLCTGRDFPDALSAAPLARLLNAPLLLTRRDAVDAPTMAELARLGVAKVYVIGGTGVISDAVTTQISAAGMTWERISGGSRYSTSAEVAKKIDTLLSGHHQPHRAFFACGTKFPDALAVSPVAAASLTPILLVKPDELPTPVSDVVDSMNLTSGIIVGGTSVVSNGVRDSLRTLMVANGGDPMDPLIVERWFGADRYATAVSVVEHALEARWVDLDTLGIATGRKFPDALGGGAALGGYGGALLLTQTTALPKSVALFLDSHDYEVGRIDVFGGADVVSDAVKSAAASTLK